MLEAEIKIRDFDTASHIPPFLPCVANRRILRLLLLLLLLLLLPLALVKR